MKFSLVFSQTQIISDRVSGNSILKKSEHRDQRTKHWSLHVHHVNKLLLWKRVHTSASALMHTWEFIAAGIKNKLLYTKTLNVFFFSQFSLLAPHKRPQIGSGSAFCLYSRSKSLSVSTLYTWTLSFLLHSSFWKHFNLLQTVGGFGVHAFSLSHSRSLSFLLVRFSRVFLGIWGLLQPRRHFDLPFLSPCWIVKFLFSVLTVGSSFSQKNISIFAVSGYLQHLDWSPNRGMKEHEANTKGGLSPLCRKNGQNV